MLNGNVYTMATSSNGLHTTFNVYKTAIGDVYKTSILKNVLCVHKTLFCIQRILYVYKTLIHTTYRRQQNADQQINVIKYNYFGLG